MALTVSCGISGFENPTLQYQSPLINLSTLFVHSPSSTRIVPCPNSYLEWGIDAGDWLLVDGALQASHNDLILIRCVDEYAITKRSILTPHSGSFDDVEIVVLGVVTLSIHHYRKAPHLPSHETLNELDLHTLLVTQEYSTVFCRAAGHSMLPYIHNDDLMIMERQLKLNDHDPVF